ncbi:hypothetical protein SNE40_012138 [Patella caerulea]|uniref:Uncharacterized protein n=1 Tax=Patella caerulea TaxID=87958 RepID=A0AAN8JQW2_PATCE
MQAAIVLVLMTAVATQAFIFNGCKQDSDCNNGCCEHSFFNSRCVAKSRYLQPCSTTSCGCVAGLKCVKESEVTSVAIEVHAGGNGLVCEQTGTTGSPTTVAPTAAPTA